MSVKHVAFVVKYFPTVSETFIVNQINSLIDDGIKVRLYAYQKVDSSIVHKSLKKHDLLNSVAYFTKPPVSKLARFWSFIKWTIQNVSKVKWSLYFKSLNVFKYGKDAYTLKLFFESQWFLVPYDFDIIHAHFGMNGNRIAYVKACEMIPKQVKLINTFHGYDLMPNQLEQYKKEYNDLLQEADAFTVNTHYLESLLQQVNDFKKPCFILPVGLDTFYFKKQNIEKDNSYFDIVFCGRLIALKGPDMAIEIIKRLHDIKHTHVRLHILGDGPLRQQLEKKVQEINLQESIIFYGVQSQDFIVQQFEKADVFLLPGRHEPETGRAETQGLVIQEAQAMELPVFVSDAGGMKYGLLNNKSGFVIKEGDIDGFVVAINKLIINPKLKLEMGKKGREFVKKYDNSILIEKLQKIYFTTNQ